MQPHVRATFGAEELAVVLSHYDLGVIESVTEFVRGSRRSPKVGVVSERGKYLLKRRPVDAVHLARLPFIHRVQKRLIGVGFPTPKLVTTRDARQEVLQLRDHIYELFEFVPGQSFQQSAGQAREAGVTLAHFHVATDQLTTDPRIPVPRGDYHDVAGVRTGLCNIGATLSSHDSFTGDEAELAGLTQFLLLAYDRAAENVNRGEFASWTERIIHSDWHPGNLLFRNDTVVAVLDYDTVRSSRRVIDVANGALQFSMIAGGDPATWPDHLDEDRFRAFLSGYESQTSLSDGERGVVADLMIEALIAECVTPITETGSVGRWAGFRVLQMVRRKVAWIAATGHGPIPLFKA